MTDKVLTHSEWVAAMKAVTACVDDQPEQAINLLRALTSRSAEARDLAVTTWHVRQCQELLAQLEHERGSAEAAAEISEQAAHDAFADHNDAKHSAGWLFAQAALQRFELGEADRAMALAAQAFALVDVHLDPSTAPSLRTNRGCPSTQTGTAPDVASTLDWQRPTPSGKH